MVAQARSDGTSTELSFHPASEIFPAMEPAAFRALVEDIAHHGQKEPILVLDGQVIDGRHRIQACQQLGCEPLIREVQTNEGDPLALVISLNLHRRHLDESQRAMVAAKLANMPHGGDRKSDQSANLRLDGTSQTSAAELLNVSRRSVQSAKQVLDNGTPELITAVDRGLLAVGEAAKLVKEDLGLQKDVLTKMSSRKVSASKAVREIKREQHKRDLAESQKRISADRIANLETVCDIRVCSCAELFASGIKPDAVITDPPYPHEFLPVFTELAIGCKESSVPMVAVMSGQSYLPEVMARLVKHLRYRWTMAYLTPGGQAVQQWQAKVNASWKPVLLFGDAIEWFGDVAASKINDNDKRFHGWGQSESGMADIIDRLTKPGQLVCDPFLGGGTTAVVSLALGRRFVGCDIEASHVEQTKDRLTQ